jgi:hypothetical protein
MTNDDNSPTTAPVMGLRTGRDYGDFRDKIAFLYPWNHRFVQLEAMQPTAPRAEAADSPYSPLRTVLLYDTIR